MDILFSCTFLGLTCNLFKGHRCFKIRDA